MKARYTAKSQNKTAFRPYIYLLPWQADHPDFPHRLPLEDRPVRQSLRRDYSGSPVAVRKTIAVEWLFPLGAPGDRSSSLGAEVKATFHATRHIV
ncbi:MAG: hypothetical protein ABSE51_14600 [Terracidiphilus sp.]|jgi:hypothetical protein